MGARASDKILAAFALQPYLTISQVARLFYSKKQDGQPAKSRRFSLPNREHDFEVVPGYDSARDILNRMVARGDLKVHTSRTRATSRRLVGARNVGDDINFNRPNLYCLPGTRIPIDDKKLYGHEMDIADCFVALRQRFGEQLTRWQLKWDKGEEYDYFGARWGLWPDAVFEIADHDAVFFLEVDRGTMEWDQIADKLKRYTAFSNAHFENRFHVLFTAQGYRHDREDHDRLERLMPMLAAHRRGNQFVAACHQPFLEDPTGLVFYSPDDATFRAVRVPGKRPYELLDQLGTARSFMTLE